MFIFSIDLCIMAYLIMVSVILHRLTKSLLDKESLKSAFDGRMAEKNSAN
jgi:hypothetical protein